MAAVAVEELPSLMRLPARAQLRSALNRPKCSRGPGERRYLQRSCLSRGLSHTVIAAPKKEDPMRVLLAAILFVFPVFAAAQNSVGSVKDAPPNSRLK